MLALSITLEMAGCTCLGTSIWAVRSLCMGFQTSLLMLVLDDQHVCIQKDSTISGSVLLILLNT